MDNTNQCDFIYNMDNTSKDKIHILQFSPLLIQVASDNWYAYKLVKQPHLQLAKLYSFILSIVPSLWVWILRTFLIFLSIMRSATQRIFAYQSV